MSHYDISHVFTLAYTTLLLLSYWFEKGKHENWGGEERDD